MVSENEAHSSNQLPSIIHPAIKLFDLMESENCLAPISKYTTEVKNYQFLMQTVRKDGS